MSTLICEILDDKEVQALRAAFKREDMWGVIKETLIDKDPAIETYLKEIENLLVDPVPQPPLPKYTPPKSPPPKVEPNLADDLSVDDKERILIAVLASRGLNYFLSIHIYVALAMQKGKRSQPLVVGEILKVLRLAGSYNGLPVYSQSLLVLEETLYVLKKAVKEGECDARSVDRRLRAKFAQWSELRLAAREA
jgi:alkylhydroperoxidase/carboxymuconolactone decarboxylase family protein YurZ